MKLDFCQEIFKNTHISNLVKIYPLRAELFHADKRKDGRRDMTKLTVAFRNFTKAPTSITPTLDPPLSPTVQNLRV